MKPIISVIVPVYNVEQYLRKCLDSIIGQTVKDIEIIVVDDGSTDASGDICDSYLSKDSRIKVFHKDNGGLSSARNYGIEKSTGDYIGFVDSDDFIEPDMYETLLRILEKNNADMSMCGLYDVFDGKPRKVFNKTEEWAVDNIKAMEIVLEAKIVSVTAVNKLYKRELFNTIRYPLGKTAEDAFVIIELLDKCSVVAITNEQKYHYIHRSNSITTNKFSKKTLDVIEAYEKNYCIIEKKYTQLIDTAKMRLCWAYFYVLDRIIYDESHEYEEEKKNIILFLKKNIGFILNDKRFTSSRKIAALLLFVNNNLYKRCVQLQNRRYKIS